MNRIIEVAVSYNLRCGCRLEKGAWLTATCDHGRKFILGIRGLEEVTEKPTVVCLCGSTRFVETFDDESLRLTLEGKIVVSIGSHKSRARQYADNVGGHKKGLDVLYFRKIDMADEVLILNVGGYIGESTRRELDYARAMGKVVRFLEPEAVK